MVNEIDKTELGYLAAVLDAEGTLSIQCKYGGSTYRPMVGVSQANYHWLSGLQEVWGGAVYPNKDERPGYALMWRWYVTSEDMVKLLNAVKPYLRLKREQAELLLELQERMRGFPRVPGRRLPEEELARRRDLYRRCCLLNVKGPRGNQLHLPEPTAQLLLYKEPWERD